MAVKKNLKRKRGPRRNRDGTYEYVQCQECYQLDGEHSNDCTQAMFADNIRDSEKRAEQMAAVISDELDY